MPKPKLITLALALILAGAASAEPLRESIDRNTANANSKTNTSTATVGLPSAVAVKLRAMMQFDPVMYHKTYLERAGGMQEWRSLANDMIEAAGGAAGYQQSRVAELTATKIAVAKKLAKELGACKVERCVYEFAYRDQYIALLIPMTFESKRAGFAETKIMGHRVINDARFQHYFPMALYHAEVANKLLAAATEKGLPKDDRAVDQVIDRLYHIPFSQFDQLTRLRIELTQQSDRLVHAEPGTPIEYYAGHFGRTYKLDSDGVTSTSGGAPYFGPRHVSGQELTISTSGSTSSTGTTTISH